MPLFVVRRTRVLRIMESTSDEIEAETPKQAIAKAIEEDEADQWIEDERETLATYAEAERL